MSRTRVAPTVSGFDEILVPGELDARKEEMRKPTRIPIQDPEIALHEDAAARDSPRNLSRQSDH